MFLKVLAFSGRELCWLHLSELTGTYFCHIDIILQFFGFRHCQELQFHSLALPFTLSVFISLLIQNPCGLDLLYFNHHQPILELFFLYLFNFLLNLFSLTDFLNVTKFLFKSYGNPNHVQKSIVFSRFSRNFTLDLYQTYIDWTILYTSTSLPLNSNAFMEVHVPAMDPLSLCLIYLHLYRHVVVIFPEIHYTILFFTNTWGTIKTESQRT